MKNPIGALALAAWLLAVPSANAQLVVFDPSNFGQNALTAAHTLEQINNQVIQLQHEATMLVNEARNLTTLPFNIVSQLRAALALTTQLITQAQETQIHRVLTDPETGKPFANWQSYVTSVARDLPPVRGKADRVAMVRFLLGADPSVRA